MIQNVLKIKALRKEMFGDITTATVPEQKKEEVKRKCHQEPKCVSAKVAQFKEDMLKVWRLAFKRLFRPKRG